VDRSGRPNPAEKRTAAASSWILFGPKGAGGSVASAARTWRMNSPGHLDHTGRRGDLPRQGVPVVHHQPPPVLVPFAEVRGT
jgi:hypothetical protein